MKLVDQTGRMDELEKGDYTKTYGEGHKYVDIP
jgi:hypothetical protein